MKNVWKETETSTKCILLGVCIFPLAMCGCETWINLLKNPLILLKTSTIEDYSEYHGQCSEQTHESCSKLILKRTGC